MTSELTITPPRRLLDKRLLSALLIALTLIGLAGCRTSPVRELNGQPVPPGVSAAEVSKTIQAAGNSLGWAMKQTRPGMITGTLYLRDHMAKIEIPYSSSSYSIRYASSTNLKYDASKRTIHSNYNSWVQNLDNQIRARLASL
jgi:hypothetical protein